MGKFDGILICTDLDHTLLTDDKSISDENKRAVEYFMSEGGLFTFATGRSKPGIEFLFNRITPNAPIILFNGAEIYDIKKDEVLWLSVNILLRGLRCVPRIIYMFQGTISWCTDSFLLRN